MSATNQFETDLLELIMTNIAAPNVGDAAGLQPSAAAGSFFVSLHTATLVDADTDQTSNETTYTGYGREGVARSGAGWTVSGNTADNTAIIQFGQVTSGTPTITDFGLGFNVSGTGFLQLFGVLTASLALSPGITPEFAIGDLDITLD